MKTETCKYCARVVYAKRLNLCRAHYESISLRIAVLKERKTMLARVNVKAVAKKAGVGVTTVYKYLHNQPITPFFRECVETAIRGER